MISLPSGGARIRALVCGYAERNRRQKHIVMLQVYIDDSVGNGSDARLVLAGYMALASVWETFSDEWDQALRAAPNINYLHMVEAQNLRGQFKNWGEPKRDRKVSRMARVIKEYQPALLSFEFSISMVACKKNLSGRVPYGMASPYYLAFHQVVQQFAALLHERGVTVPLDFIFDEQDAMRTEASDLYDYLKLTLPPEHSKLLGGPPIFRNDQEFAALQAADMLAWHLRRRHDNPVEELPAHDMLFGKEHVGSELDDQTVERISNSLVKVPGIGRLIKKRQWRSAAALVAAQTAAGERPVRVPPAIMRLFYQIDNLREKIKPYEKKLRRLLRRLRRR